MAIQSYEQLIAGANKIKYNELPESNTATLVGEQLLQIVNKQQEEHQQRVKGTTEYNVSVQYPTSGTGGTNKYTLEGAIALVPQELRYVGLKLSFVNADGQMETWEYQGGAFANTGSWKQQSSGGNKILEWNTDAATTRKQVAANERKPGMQISYRNAEGEWVNEQYIGTLVTDAEWAKDSNWIKIPTQKNLADLESNISFIRSIEIYREENESHSGSTKKNINFFKGKTYSVLASNDFSSFKIGDNAVPIIANRISYITLSEDCDYFYYSKYGVVEFLIINQIDTIKELLSETTETTRRNNKVINGSEEIVFDRLYIETVPTRVTPVSLHLPGSGSVSGVIRVDEGESFIITASNYSDVRRPYAFLNEKCMMIEGAYATGVLNAETIIAPEGASFLVLNNNGGIFSIIPVNRGIKTEISDLIENVNANSNKLAKHDSLIYKIDYKYNAVVNAQGSTNITVFLTKGVTYKLLLSNHVSNFTLGTSKDGVNLGGIDANVEMDITPSTDISNIYFERYGEVDIKIYQVFNIQEQINQISGYLSLKSKYPTFSIIGDSYSTFKDYLDPDNNKTFYPANNVLSVEDTWWGMLCKEQGMLLMQNNSYSGSCVSNTDKSEHSKETSFINRMKNLSKASVIFVFGGTNDSWRGANVGDYKYADWTEEDLMNFRPAFAKLLDSLIKRCFGGKIVVIKNPYMSNGTGFTQEIDTSVDTICEHYGIMVLSPSINKATDWHPSKVGMRAIYNSVVNALGG